MLRRRSVENRSSLGRATLDLPVAEPRTALASWRAAYPQRFSITGRLRLVSHTWRLVQEVLDPLPDGLARTRLSLSSGSRGEASCRRAPCRRGSSVVSPSVTVLSGSAPVLGWFCWSCPPSRPAPDPPRLPAS